MSCALQSKLETHAAAHSVRERVREHQERANSGAGGEENEGNVRQSSDVGGMDLLNE